MGETKNTAETRPFSETSRCWDKTSVLWERAFEK